jgi:hypothetical protein
MSMFGRVVNKQRWKPEISVYFKVLSENHYSQLHSNKSHHTAQEIVFTSLNIVEIEH